METATRAPEFEGRIGFPPPENNEQVLSIEMGGTNAVPFPREPNTPLSLGQFRGNSSLVVIIVAVGSAAAHHGLYSYCTASQTMAPPIQEFAFPVLTVCPLAGNMVEWGDLADVECELRRNLQCPGHNIMQRSGVGQDYGEPDGPPRGK